MRKIRVTVGSATAEYTLLENISPTTAHALWETLPISGTVTHGRWGGSMVWTKTKREPLVSFADPEVRVTSLYPGMLFARKGPRGLGEVMLSYGEAEARTYEGNGYATPVALIDGRTDEFFGELRRCFTEGSLPIEIRQIEE